MGLRNMARKKGRSASTMLQIALAVGMFLAIASIGYSIQAMVSQEFEYFTSDIITTGSAEGGRPEGLDGPRESRADAVLLARNDRNQYEG